MPRRKSLTRRFLQHLLLISLARTILTAIGRGRAWDDWDERKLEEQAAEPRKFQRRFAQTLSFSALFFAGLALSAGAGNGVRTLLEADGTSSPSAAGATGVSGPTGPTGTTGVTGVTPASQPAVRVVMAQPQAAPDRPTAAPTARVATKAATAVASRPLASPAASSPKKVAVVQDARRAALAGEAVEAAVDARSTRRPRPRRRRRSIPRSPPSRRRPCG